MNPVMLALSTFRKSEKAINRALLEAEKTKNLLLVYVVDVNLARYLIDSDINLSAKLQDTCEQDILREHHQEGQAYVNQIENRAREKGISVSVVFKIGRFGIVCKELMEKENPSMIITTRTNRPEWVKKFFGSPVSFLIEHATCPIIEA